MKNLRPRMGQVWQHDDEEEEEDEKEEEFVTKFLQKVRKE